MGTNFWNADATPASNTTIGGIASEGSSAISNFDNIVRDMHAQSKKFAQDLGGTATVGGTANVITLTTNQVMTSLVDGLLVAFIAGGDNTVTGVTVNVDALGAKTVKKALLGVETALAVGDIQSGDLYFLRYRSAWASAAGAFQLIDLNHSSNDATTSGTLAQFAATTSAELASVISNETGSGALVFATSPTLVTPALGTPSAAVLTNATGTAAGLTAGNVTTNANLTGHVTSVGNAAVLGSFTSAQLAAALTNETGSGAAVFGTAPTIASAVLNTAVSGTAVLDEDTMSSNSATKLATQQSIKAYVDASVSGAPNAYFGDEKTTTTDGGTFTTGDWRTRDLNTEWYDPDSLISISSNAFTPTVDGWIEASAPAVEVGGHKTRLQKTSSGGATVAVGTVERTSASTTQGSRSIVAGAVSAGETYEIQHQCTDTKNTIGFGDAAGFSAVEIYTTVKFYRT